MIRHLLPVALLGALLVGCDTPPVETVEGGGVATAQIDGRPYTFRVFAQPSAYDPSEVVLRAYADELSRAVMLTFRPALGAVAVNTAMTGYWDLGLCTPSDAYVVAGAGDATVRVTEQGPRALRGTFSLRVQREGDPTDVVAITDGTFDVEVGGEPFEYCIEG
ncbi:hypothetical protein [Rubrivirga sp. IMCC45206]|uniref:hypothetical protein n=1 Tax=Rubrivirga sp. IMCC45206 TaxID=3391614 RepID=UPI00398FC23F